MMYSLDELGILPSGCPTSIEHRGEVDVFVEGTTNLPVFVAPMTSVVDTDNYKVFSKQGFIPIIPRKTGTIATRLILCNKVWCAFSLSEFETHFCEKTDSNENPLVLIDIANGHMKKLYDLVKMAKSCWKNITIMVGNIAHPLMYWECYKAGVDFVRVGIGTGSVCTTGVKTGIHASLLWLLEGINKVKEEMRLVPATKPLPKIIADGGINTLDRAIKCLALGADYIMCGKLFAQCEEACGKILEISLKSGRGQRAYYGMASFRGQADISSDKLTVSQEGIEVFVDVLYTVKELSEDFSAALRSAMSYTNSKNLEAFKQAQIKIMSPMERASYYK